MKRVVAPALFALLAFAANSILCRMALRRTHIDPASFTSIRLVAGALTLWILARVTGKARTIAGNWPSAFALLVYAIAFSFAYLGLAAGTGALLLFGAVQVVMVAAGFISRERIDRTVVCGWLFAVIGLTLLLLPGAGSPPILNAIFMLTAGIAWAIYSLRGRSSQDARADTAGNFARSVPGAMLVSALFWGHRAADTQGLILAAVSGSLTSGLGYVAWYAALPNLSATAAATAQLSVPVLAALGGIVLFGEPVNVRIAVASVLVLSGTAVAVRRSLTLQMAHT